MRWLSPGSFLASDRSHQEKYTKQIIFFGLLWAVDSLPIGW
jgi:hypothetical protein